MTIVSVDDADAFLKSGKVPADGVEQGSSFGWFDQMMFGWTDKYVYDYADWEARDLAPFLAKDYKARQIMNVLQLPISSATWTITPAKGDKGESEWLANAWEADPVNGGCKTPLDHIIDQCTSAIAYKRSYFEKVFKTDDDGKIFYDKVAWRPQTTCRLMRDPRNANFVGFEQEQFWTGPGITSGVWPIKIPKERAYVYIHGQRTDPINGVSDMEVPYWCYKTKQKIMLLMFTFLEGVALPRQIVFAQELGVARQVAGQMAGLRNSGVLPVARAGGAGSVEIQSIDSSGKGMDQFMTAISWLDGAAGDSVLAGFLNLTGTAAARGGVGGFGVGLSKDASDFFLQAREADTKEIAVSLRKDLLAPIVRYNFGKQAAVPQFQFEPLNDEDKSNSIDLLKAMLTMPPGGTNPVPAEFIAALGGQVAQYLGLDGDKTVDQFTKAAADAKAQAAQMSAQMASPQGQAVAGMAGAVGAATTAVQGATTGAEQVTTPEGQALLKHLGVT